MPNDNSGNPLGYIAPLIEKVAKVKLRGGVVGKLSMVLIVTAVSLAAIACATRDAWVSVLTVAVIFILVWLLGRRMLDFADKNPQAALFEGAEFLLHEQMQMAMKGYPELPFDPADLTSDPDSHSEVIPPSVANLPDSSMEESE